MSGIDSLLSVMARLRDPNGGCPWDLEQDFASLAPYAIEEAYEVQDAIERNDMAGFKSELGDLLLQVVFQSQMASEKDLFTFDDVARGIADKMIKRHPHVFGDADSRTTENQLSEWEKQKEEERTAGGSSSALDDVTRTLPALTRAVKLQKRAARVGFEWHSVQRIVEKLDEEIFEFKAEINNLQQDIEKIEDELGDVFFVLTNMARTLKLDPEQVLRKANTKFERRFRAMENHLEKPLPDCSLEEMAAAWDEIKKLWN